MDGTTCRETIVILAGSHVSSRHYSTPRECCGFRLNRSSKGFWDTTRDSVTGGIRIRGASIAQDILRLFFAVLGLLHNSGGFCDSHFPE